MSDTNMDDANGLSSTFSGLNVNAKPFVPNPNAAAFVPSFMKSTVSPQGGFPSSGGTGEPPPPQPPDEPVDSWEDSAQDDISEVKEPTPASAEQDSASARVSLPEEVSVNSMEVDEEQVEGQRANGETGEEEIEDEDEEEELPPAMRSRIKSGDGESPASRKEHVNVVFVGHVDAGKSTIGGQIMYLTGMVDKRTLEKYEREAKEKNRESWYLSWALDTNLEEREKGKTVEVGRAFFETDKKHFTILDAPGHRSFVPNMIGGASQADLAVLVISARKGEFETGFDRGGQTREHAMLAKTAGVKHLVVLVNKMDDPTVQWSEERFNECKDKLTPYLRKCGFNPKTDFVFMPCSGLTGEFLKERSGNVATWYTGPCFIEYIENMPSLTRNLEGPFLLPVVDKYKDMGTIVLGKVESGCCVKGQNLLLMPNRTPVTVDQLFSDEDEVQEIRSGDNVKIKLKGIEEEDVSGGFVLCDATSPCRTGKVFDAQVVILEHKSIICAGYSAVCHIHTLAEEVSLKALICLIDKKTGDKSKTRPRFVKQDQIAIMRLEAAGVICLETFKDFPQLGRFTLRDEGRTIAIGKVLKVIE